MLSQLESKSSIKLKNMPFKTPHMQAPRPLMIDCYTACTAY